MSENPDFEEFYLQMHPRVWAFLFRSTDDPAVAEELAQEAFVRLLASRGAALPWDERRAYVFRIAVNLIRAAARRRAREGATPLDDMPELAALQPADPIARRASVVFNGLGERERELLWLAHVEKWTHSEIAAALGLASGSVRVLLHRARRRFLERFEKEKKNETD